MNTGKMYFVRRAALLAALVFVIVLVAIANPIGYNHLVRAAGMDALSMKDPYIAVGNCKMYDGESVSYADGVWTTSTGCKVESKEIFVRNWSKYSFDIDVVHGDMTSWDSTADSGFRFGVSGIAGVRMNPGSETVLAAEKPSKYTVSFLIGIPSLFPTQ